MHVKRMVVVDQPVMAMQNASLLQNNAKDSHGIAVHIPHTRPICNQKPHCASGKSPSLMCRPIQPSRAAWPGPRWKRMIH